MQSTATAAAASAAASAAVEKAAQFHVASFASCILLLKLCSKHEQAGFFMNALVLFKASLPRFETIEAMEQMSDELWQKAKAMEDELEEAKKSLVNEVQKLLIAEQQRTSTVGYYYSHGASGGEGWGFKRLR